MSAFAGEPTMPLRVAVWDPLPMFRLGVLASLDDASVDVEAPEDILAWVSRPDRRLVLLTVRAAQDWHLLVELCRAGSDVVVVAVLEDADLAAHVRAIAVGATGAIARDASRDQFRAVLLAAAAGDSLLPATVVRALADRRVAEPETPQAPSLDEIGWLRDLAVGRTVGQLADRAGYSERMMFRLLRQLYTRLGATDRTAALILAKERDWL